MGVVVVVVTTGVVVGAVDVVVGIGVDATGQSELKYAQSTFPLQSPFVEPGEVPV